MNQDDVYKSKFSACLRFLIIREIRLGNLNVVVCILKWCVKQMPKYSTRAIYLAGTLSRVTLPSRPIPLQEATTPPTTIYTKKHTDKHETKAFTTLDFDVCSDSYDDGGVCFFRTGNYPQKNYHHNCQSQRQNLKNYPLHLHTVTNHTRQTRKLTLRSWCPWRVFIKGGQCSGGPSRPKFSSQNLSRSSIRL